MKLKKLGTNNKAGIVIAILLIAFAVVSRMMPHPANFAPIAAIALFGGAILPRKLALTLPLGAMIISDLFLGLHPLIFFTWGSFVLIALLSSSKFKVLNLGNLATGSVGASMLFFLVTNFGVWIEGRLYDRTLSGLIQSYYNALPFFRNTLLGDLVYAGLIFGAYALATSLVNTNESMASQHAQN